MTDACRLCREPHLKVALTLDNMPRWNHRLISESEVKNDRGVTITVYRCPSCGFVMMPFGLAEKYYDDYVNAPSFSSQMKEFQDKQAKGFVEQFGLAGKPVLEIGCGDGNYLDALRRAGANVVGVEPSRAQREIAKSLGLSVEAGILTAERRLSNGPFDAFVTRQVLEHVPEVHDFLCGIRNNLKAGAAGLVEVPNLDKILADRRFFDFIPEHVNYFTPRTLRMTLEQAGFDVLEITPVMFDEALMALVSLPEVKADGFERVASRATDLARQIASFIDEHKKRSEAVAIWGAGGKGLSLLAAADVSRVDALVDADPHKIGRFTPVSHLRVSSPDVLREHKIDAVIITAPTYHREILQILEDRYHFRGRIAVVDDDFTIIDGSRA
jgi:cyclopropane fatty-acyl-phospholipid synthase-like methyltransferase